MTGAAGDLIGRRRRAANQIGENNNSQLKKLSEAIFLERRCKLKVDKVESSERQEWHVG